MRLSTIIFSYMVLQVLLLKFILSKQSSGHFIRIVELLRSHLNHKLTGFTK